MLAACGLCLHCGALQDNTNKNFTLFLLFRYIIKIKWHRISYLYKITLNLLFWSLFLFIIVSWVLLIFFLPLRNIKWHITEFHQVFICYSVLHLGGCPCRHSKTSPPCPCPAQRVPWCCALGTDCWTFIRCSAFLCFTWPGRAWRKDSTTFSTKM